MNIMAKICNMIISTSVISTDDTGDYPVVETRFFGKTVRSQVLLPYGIVSRCPNGGLATRFTLMAKESNSMAMCADPRNRMKGLELGEIGLYNQETQSFVLLRQNGDIEVNSQGNVTVTSASNVNINATTLTVNANMVLNGNYESTGTMTNNSVNVGSTHAHPYTWTDPAGSGTTGAPQ